MVTSSDLQVFVLSVLVVGKEGDVPVLEVSFEDRKGWKKEAAADETSHSFFFGRWVVPQVVDMAMPSLVPLLQSFTLLLFQSYSNWNVFKLNR